jgi:mannose-6-phosphate isomerase-like protein (cupin superfamily)
MTNIIKKPTRMPAAGTPHVRLKDGEFDVHAGQAVHIEKGEWVQYSPPDPAGGEYIAVCLPAFSPETANRDMT